MIQVGQSAPDFKAAAVVDGEFKDVQLSDHRGQKVVLFFYPADFTLVCPTEVVAFQDRLAEFTERNTVVMGASVDSKESHLAWTKVPRAEGGIQGVTYPLIADRTHAIARAYNVLLEDEGEALRGLFLIDEDGVVQHITVNHDSLGRSVDEVLRLVDALSFVQEHQGSFCPANWQKGDKAIDKNRAQEYFQAVKGK